MNNAMTNQEQDHSSLITHPSSLRLMIVAGEASGDRHGAALADGLRRLYPAVEFEMFGAGGEAMRAAGVETLVDAREVAIIGIPEIARGIGKLYGAYRSLIKAARARRPAAVVLIDWPDFNMRLARALRRAGLRIVYYISPQVWAWRRYRVRALRRDVDRMLVILPFEEEFYRREGLAVEYVGHPLVETIKPTSARDEFFSRHGLDPARPVIALLPGSRHKEIHYHVPIMADAARRLADAQFVLPLASTVSRNQVEALLAQVPDAPPITLIERDTTNALFHAAFAIVASGTATVEAALAGTPMVIIYRASQVNWRLIRPLIHLNTFGMVNLIAGRRVVPELIQHDATGERIAAEVRAILSDPQRLAGMRRDLNELRQRLAAGGSRGAERAARAVMQVAANEAADCPVN
jgi:lipid-A-disaccharide synthase